MQRKNLIRDRCLINRGHKVLGMTEDSGIVEITGRETVPERLYWRGRRLIPSPEKS
jgi:hypothetical protein